MCRFVIDADGAHQQRLANNHYPDYVSRSSWSIPHPLSQDRGPSMAFSRA